MDPQKDLVEVDGKPLLTGAPNVYFLVNKPKARTHVWRCWAPTAADLLLPVRCAGLHLQQRPG